LRRSLLSVAHTHSCIFSYFPIAVTTYLAPFSTLSLRRQNFSFGAQFFPLLEGSFLINCSQSGHSAFLNRHFEESQQLKYQSHEENSEEVADCCHVGDAIVVWVFAARPEKVRQHARCVNDDANLHKITQK
jgi:hypothetical protein